MWRKEQSSQAPLKPSKRPSGPQFWLPGSADGVQYGTHFPFLNFTVTGTRAVDSGFVSPLVITEGVRNSEEGESLRDSAIGTSYHLLLPTPAATSEEVVPSGCLGPSSRVWPLSCGLSYTCGFITA